MVGSCNTPRSISSIPSSRLEERAGGGVAGVRAEPGPLEQQHDFLPLPLGHGLGQPRLSYVGVADDALPVGCDTGACHDRWIVDCRARHVALACAALAW